MSYLEPKIEMTVVGSSYRDPNVAYSDPLVREHGCFPPRTPDSDLGIRLVRLVSPLERLMEAGREVGNEQG